jgi:hypothetical protein
MNPIAIGWGRLKLVHNTKEKTFETKQKDGMT